jgi:hypothetical protein
MDEVLESLNAPFSKDCETMDSDRTLKSVNVFQSTAEDLRKNYKLADIYLIWSLGVLELLRKD